MQSTSRNLNRLGQGAWLGALCLLAGVLAVGGGETRQVQSASELKAQHVSNFIRFVKWPVNSFPREDSPVRISVLADDAFATVLRETMGQQVIDGRSLVVESSRHLSDITACHVLVVGSNHAASVVSGIVDIDRFGTLTIGDGPGLAERGVMINFIRDGATIRFEINTHAAARARLKISSQLLNLAARVYPRGHARKLDR